jgi:hypothetical protein
MHFLPCGFFRDGRVLGAPRLSDLDIHRDYAEKGNEPFKRNVFGAAYRSGEPLRNNDGRQDDPIRVVAHEGNRSDMAAKKINENIDEVTSTPKSTV